MTLTCQQVSHRYRTPHGTLTALENVNFTVQAQEFVSIVGPSGCGKTTLLKLLAGLLHPTDGRICYANGHRTVQPHNALVFQEHGLLPWLTVVENVAFGLEMQGVRRPERHAQARRFLQDVGLADFAGHYPHQLSVGMRQRAAIARAFAANPQMLLMDEPFSALDAQTRLLLQEDLLRIWDEHQKTVVYVTHDIHEAILLSDRVLVMTGRPGTIGQDIRIPLERPRNLLDRNYADIQEISWQIWNMIKAEVLQSVKRSR